nr:uncharacterized protein CI109_001293 [Kwoniella shandongensis]KAA5530489.1 hypothetical protein CI109_001293 [Kwoniella shandongensis]
MADGTRYGNAVDFDVDLHSIYAAYLGLFESSNTDWWDKSWGGYFTTFNEFLGFGWEVMVVVDSVTGRPHIAVRREQIALFAKMIRTRFGESLPKDPPTTLPIIPVATRNLSLRRLVTLHDLTSYRKLSHSLPAAELSYLRTRVRSGEVSVAEQLFYAGGSKGERDTGGIGVRDNGVGYTFASVKSIWWEKGAPPGGLVPGVGRTQGKGLILEVGTAVLRCANLRAVNVWPPVPEENYRKSHYIAEEWVDKRANSIPPNYPRAYAFGKSNYVAERSIEKILDATLGALASQENDGSANTLVLLTVGEPLPLPLPSASTLPSNILHLDLLALEYNLLRRAQAESLPGTPDRHQPLGSLMALLQTLQIPVPPFAPLNNAGNEAYYTLLAFQKLMMGETRLPELLFAQPDGYGYGRFPGMYPSYPALPLPPPIGHSRRDSSGSGRYSDRRSSLPPSPSQPRPRPVSMGDSLRSLHDSGSVPSTVKERKAMTRSQTVFWDDADYAQNGAPPRDRGMLSSGSSRSISFDAGREVKRSSPNVGPSGLSSTSLKEPDGSGSTGTTDSTKMSSSSENKGREKRDKRKLKSEKSVKDIAGALARFWVG